MQPQELPGKTYSPEKVYLKSDHGQLIQYSLEAFDVDEGFSIFLRLMPVAGTLLGGMKVLKGISDDGPLMSILGPWISEGIDEVALESPELRELREVSPESGDPPESSPLGGQVLPFLRALGEVAGSDIAQIPAAFASALQEQGGSAFIKEILASAHRWDPKAKEGGRVGDDRNFDLFYRRNYGEALKACWAVCLFNFGPMVTLGK